jgi:hypothetical protein
MAVTEAPALRSNLREQIKDVMLQRIVSGAYPPGARLVETRIAQSSGYPRPPFARRCATSSSSAASSTSHSAAARCATARTIPA